jgi:hypothetical protein
VKGSISNPGRTLQANHHVFWANQLTTNISDDDEHHILAQSAGRMVLNIHG